MKKMLLVLLTVFMMGCSNGTTDIVDNSPLESFTVNDCVVNIYASETRSIADGTYCYEINQEGNIISTGTVLISGQMYYFTSYKGYMFSASKSDNGLSFPSGIINDEGKTINKPTTGGGGGGGGGSGGSKIKLAIFKATSSAEYEYCAFLLNRNTQIVDISKDGKVFISPSMSHTGNVLPFPQPVMQIVFDVNGNCVNMITGSTVTYYERYTQYTYNHVDDSVKSITIDFKHVNTPGWTPTSVPVGTPATHNEAFDILAGIEPDPNGLLSTLVTETVTYNRVN